MAVRGGEGRRAKALSKQPPDRLAAMCVVGRVGGVTSHCCLERCCLDGIQLPSETLLKL